MTPHARSGPRSPNGAPAAPAWFPEFQLMLHALISCALTLVGAAIAIGLSHWLQSGYSARLEDARRLRDAALHRYSHVEHEKQDIHDYQPPFVALQGRGLIGGGGRLDWVEALRAVQRERKLLPIAYDIAPQQPLRLAARLDTGAYQLNGSRMKLHLDLLHEMDLLNFLDDMRQRGFFGVQDCSIKRNTMALENTLSGHLIADCTLAWLSLDAAASPSAYPKEAP